VTRQARAGSAAFWSPHKAERRDRIGAGEPHLLGRDHPGIYAAYKQGNSIGHHARENLHHAVIHVTLPEKGGPRERWLTREEAARLIWTCWRARDRSSIAAL
jgi:hypothetical protein